MVLDQPRPEENVRANVERIEAAAERAVSLTRHLLAFSRKQVLQPKVIDLNALTVNLDQMLRRLIGDDVVVETVTAPDLGSVNADPGQIEQVIMNLVLNARDAMPKGGKLTLETANVDLDPDYARDHDGVHSGRYVMLAVSDTGVGMDPEIQSRIFEPFFTTKETGTGNGARSFYGVRNRPTERRPYLGLQRTRSGNDIQDLLRPRRSPCGSHSTDGYARDSDSRD